MQSFVALLKQPNSMKELKTLEAAEWIGFWHNKKPCKISIDIDERYKYRLCIAAWDISDDYGNRGFCSFRIKEETAIFILSVLTGKLHNKGSIALFNLCEEGYEVRVNKRKIKQLLNYNPNYHRELIINSLLTNLG